MYLGRLTEEQSDRDDYFKFLSRVPEEGDWFIRFDWMDTSEDSVICVECICVFYDSAVCRTSVPISEVAAKLSELKLTAVAPSV